MAKRLQAMGTAGYEEAFKFKILPDRLDAPVKVKKATKFFVNSMSDLFHEKMPFEFLDRVFETIRGTPRHTYQILTKRERVLETYFQTRTVPDNVWLGVSVEMKSQRKRIDALRKIDAKIRFLSVEPLLESLGAVDLTDIHWVIVGGESGFKARPMKEKWVLDNQKQCDAQSVDFFFKQWGAWGADGVKRSKKANGRMLLGKEWSKNPAPEVSFA